MKYVVLVVIGVLWAGCAVGNGSPGAPDGPKFIGGNPASEGQFPATVHLPSACTAVKVGPRAFMTAAHCVLDETTGELDAQYSPGENLRLHHGVDLTDAIRVSTTVVRTLVHPNYVRALRASIKEEGTPVLRDTVDLALVEVADDTDAIGIATVVEQGPDEGTSIVVGGYGCNNPVFLPDGTVRVESDDGPWGTLTYGETMVLEVLDHVILFRNRLGLDPFGLCPGDSGGAVYLDDRPEGVAATDHVFDRIVAVNSFSGLTESGMTRTDKDALDDCLTWAMQRPDSTQSPTVEGVSVLCDPKD